jgi:membrane protein DedA with SNARE-associated domain
MFSGLADWVTDVVDTLGYVGVALLVALENVFPPIPSEIILPFAGFVARDGGATLPGMIAAATVGSLIGALVLYGIAAWIGPDRLDSFLLRYGKWFRLTPADVRRAEGWFDDNADRAVLICRCVPLLRSLVSIPAGFRRMNLARFLVLTLIGSVIWNTALVTAGYVLRDNWEDVEPIISIAQYVVIALIVAGIAWFAWTKLRRRSTPADSHAASVADSRPDWHENAEQR